LFNSETDGERERGRKAEPRAEEPPGAWWLGAEG
jgi:hypothetical protein